MTPFIRNGKLVDGVLKGLNIQKLSVREQSDLLDAINKSERGGQLTAADMQAVATARRKGL